MLRHAIAASLLGLLVGGCSAARPDRAWSSATTIRGSGAAADAVREALKRGDIVVLAVFGDGCHAGGPDRPALERLETALPPAVTVIGVSERETSAKPFLIDCDDSMADEDAPPPGPSLVVLDREGTVQYVQAGYREPDDLSMIRTVVMSLVALER